VSEVVSENAAESQEVDASSESVEAPATPAFDEATWKKRLSGKDQKAQARIAALEAEAQAAKAEAHTVRLSSQYPLAAELLGEDLAKFDEVRVAEINGRLAKEQAAESEEPEPRIDTNSPRRAIARPKANDLDSAKRSLQDLGNPWFDESAWGSTNRR
jgi:hypothetical protein